MMKPLRAQGASAKQAKSLASPALSEVELTNMEWGEFFPIALSPFGYNETVAQEYYPLNKTQALQLNAAWKEDDVSNQYQGVKVEVPQHIENVSDEITKQILTCEQCLKNYRIINQELKFYRQQNLPIPLLCPDCRHKRRMGLRNPRKLWERKCTKCSTTIKSSYSSERPEKIYCEQCYQETIY